MAAATAASRRCFPSSSSSSALRNRGPISNRGVGVVAFSPWQRRRGRRIRPPRSGTSPSSTSPSSTRLICKPTWKSFRREGSGLALMTVGCKKENIQAVLWESMFVILGHRA